MTRVFVPGVFDVFHIGHLRYLKQASEAGDYLIVGVQDDREVRRCKGADPVIPLVERMLIVENLRFVQEVISYTSVFQGPLLKSLRIDVLVVGEEYGADECYPDQRKTLAYCVENGIRVVRAPRTTHISSTEIRGRLRDFWNSRAALADELPAGVTVLGSFAGNQDKVREETEREVDMVLRAVSQPNGKSLLDLGCGDARQLAPLCRHFAKAVGVDFAGALLEKAQQRLAAEGSQAQLFACDAAEFRSSEPFDVVLLSGLLPCLDDEQAERLVGNLSTLAGPQSKILVRSSVGLERRIDVVNQFSAELGSRYTAFYRTNEEMLNLFRRHGFQVNNIQPLYQHRADTAVWWYEFTPDVLQRTQPGSELRRMSEVRTTYPAETPSTSRPT